MDAAEKNQWFRPSDVCVAPDGSLIVADWYDPGVGGHRMQDTERGRLFHVTRSGLGGQYQMPKVDFSTAESAAKALRSPNQATRYLAWTALERMGAQSQAPLEQLWADENPRMRARALWVLIHLGLPKDQMLKYVRSGLQDDHPDIRATAVRTVVHLRDQIVTDDIRDVINLNDPAPEVRRELLLALRQLPLDVNHLAVIWSVLADQYQAGDRWYLEALGIAAENHWDGFLDAWLRENREQKLSSLAGRDIVWRSRGLQTPELIAEIIADDSLAATDTTRYFRAFDLMNFPEKQKTLAALAFGISNAADDKSNYVVMEAASRLDANDLTEDQQVRLGAMIENRRGTPAFVSLVGKFSVEQYYGDLLSVAASADNRQLAADAMGVLMDKKQQGPVQAAVVKADEATREILCDALVNCGKRPAALLLARISKRPELDSDMRTYAIRRLGEIQSGANDMIQWIEKKEEIDPVLMPAIAASLHRAPWGNVKRKAQELFPLPPSKDNRPLPAISDFASRSGEVANGKKIFEGVGTCAKCHIVEDKGIEVGPNLSEIGSKLTREAMYESILFPSAGISHNYENWSVVTVDGNMITGVLLGETESEIQLKDDKGITHRIAMEDVEGKKQQKLSLMPEGIHKEMSEQELVDLVEYLMTLKKGG